MSRSVSFPDVVPADLEVGDVLLTDPNDPAGSSVEWRICELYERGGVRVAEYVTSDGADDEIRFADPDLPLVVRRGDIDDAAGWGRLVELFRRRNSSTSAQDGETAELIGAALLDDHPAPANTLNDPVDLDVAEIDPAGAPPELPAPTTTAQDAVAALCADHPELPTRLPWRYYDDGARLNLDLVAAPHEYQRGLVYLLAALLAAQPVARPREPADGYVLLSVAGYYEGVRVAVEATVAPDPADGLDRIYQALADRTPVDRIPELETPTALPAAGAT